MINIKYIQSTINEKKYLEALREIENSFSEATAFEKIVLYDYQSRIFLELNKFCSAENCLKNAITLLENEDNNHRLYIKFLQSIAFLLARQNKYEEAINYAKKELNYVRNKFPNNIVKIENIIVTIANYYCELGDFDTAKKLNNDVIKYYTENKGRNSLVVSECLNNIGHILEKEGLKEDSISFFEEALQIRNELLGVHRDTAFTLLNLGIVLATLGRYQLASRHLLEARKMYRALEMEDSQYFSECEKNIQLCWDAVVTPC